MVRFLLQAGASPNVPDESGRTPLDYAVNAGSMNAVRELLDANASLNVLDLGGDLASGFTAVGETPLHLACRLGQLQIIGALLEHGADIHQKNGSSLTALRLMQHQRLVPADFSEEDLRLATAPDLSARVNGGKVRASDALIACSAVGDIRRVATLVRKQRNLDIVDAKGRSPLGEACKAGHFDVANYLLKEAQVAGSDTRTATHRCTSPLAERISPSPNCFWTTEPIPRRQMTTC